MNTQSDAMEQQVTDLLRQAETIWREAINGSGIRVDLTFPKLELREKGSAIDETTLGWWPTEQLHKLPTKIDIENVPGHVETVGAEEVWLEHLYRVSNIERCIFAHSLRASLFSRFESRWKTGELRCPFSDEEYELFCAKLDDMAYTDYQGMTYKKSWKNPLPHYRLDRRCSRNEVTGEVGFSELIAHLAQEHIEMFNRFTPITVCYVRSEPSSTTVGDIVDAALEQRHQGEMERLLEWVQHLSETEDLKWGLSGYFLLAKELIEAKLKTESGMVFLRETFEQCGEGYINTLHKLFYIALDIFPAGKRPRDEMFG